MDIQHIRSVILQKQRGIAAYLSKQEKKISVRKKKILLTCFCAVFGSLSIFLIAKTFYQNPAPGPVLNTGQINIPFHIGKNFHQPGVMIDKETYNRVEDFKKYLDSLKANDIGRYAEIMNTRPHLMDSISSFEKIYLSQLKK
jgi:hypothetical protein